MAEEVKSNYTCTELELYAIAELGYNNLEGDLAAFAAKSTKYTAEFLAALRQTRSDAMALPDEEARDVEHQVLRNKLVKDFLPPVLDNFNDLKGYIKDGWPDEDPEPRYEAAGGTKYAKAANKNWENVVGLNDAMKKFIAKNTVMLAVPGGMPDTFVAKMIGDVSNFNTNYALFMQARETGVARDEKITANNLLHKELMNGLEDGAERVFRNDAAKRKNYVFATLKYLVSPPGSASLRVLVIRENDTPVAEASVTIRLRDAELLEIVAPPITVLSGADGVALFEHVDPGRYNGSATSSDGLVSVPFSKEIDTGVKARVTVMGEFPE